MVEHFLPVLTVLLSCQLYQLNDLMLVSPLGFGEQSQSIEMAFSQQSWVKYTVQPHYYDHHLLSRVTGVCSRGATSDPVRSW